MGKRSRSQSPGTNRKRQTSAALTTTVDSSRSDTLSSTATSHVPCRPQITSSASSSEVGTASTGLGISPKTTKSRTLSPQRLGSRPNALVTANSNGSNTTQPAPVAMANILATGLATPLTMASSHDGTVTSPYVANGFQYPASVSLMQYTPTESFPIFRTSDVFVKTNLVSPPKQWQLHSAILARHSPWFARTLQDKLQEGNEAPTWFSYTIEETHGKVGLVRRQADGERPKIEAVDGGMIGGIAIKVENGDDTTPVRDATPSAYVQNAVTSVQKKNHAVLVDIYNQILGTFYSIPPSIPTSSITAALTHSEQLAEIAHGLGCLHLLTSHIGNTLLQYRQSLFSAIKSDPVRWIRLAMVLENDNIYTEALIHLAGAYPCQPWPTKRNVLPEEIRRLIDTKSLELDRMCLEAERELLLLTIEIRNGDAVQPQDNSQFDTWIVVSTFSHALRTEFNLLENDSKKYMKRGAMFRKIAKGGSAYMDYEEVRKLMERIMPSAVECLGEDLAALKKCASECVEELAKNELVLDVEANDVGYLTCVKVGEKDIPWRAIGDERA